MGHIEGLRDPDFLSVGRPLPSPPAAQQLALKPDSFHIRTGFDNKECLWCFFFCYALSMSIAKPLNYPLGKAISPRLLSPAFFELQCYLDNSCRVCM